MSSLYSILVAILTVAISLVSLIACEWGREDIDLGNVYDELLGGETTAFSTGRNAFDLSARNLNNAERRIFEVGDSFFTQNWVSAPASTDARDGLGPTFNAQSCSSCHADDGRAKPPSDDQDPERGLVLRLSVPGIDQAVPEPNYGGQLQDRSINQIPAEGRIIIRYQIIDGEYPDGTPYSLRAPTYSIDELAFGPIHPDTMLSPRIAPAVFGTGLLEAIPENTILTSQDPNDENGDGISGRANMVLNVHENTLQIGRFGWKANHPTLEQQIASAFRNDIGITSNIFNYNNCPEIQTECSTAPDGGNPELPDDILDRVTFYIQTLAVPAMRNVDDSEVEQGARLFVTSGCAQCHTPMHITSQSHPVEPLSGQTIFPYTDLLLHDMGEGLADSRPDGLASGREWRTAPLWGIGLIETVNGHTTLLHDGRARNIEEAILWHGGEAEKSRNIFMQLSIEDRKALIKFLRSL